MRKEPLLSRKSDARGLRAPKKSRSIVLGAAAMASGVLFAACDMPYQDAIVELPGVVLDAPLHEGSGTSATDRGPKKLTGSIAPSGVTYGPQDTLAGGEDEKGALALAEGTGWVKFPHQ